MGNTRSENTEKNPFNSGITSFCERLQESCWNKVGRVTSVMNDVPNKCVSVNNNYDVWTDYVRTIVSRNITILCVLK